MMTIRTLQKKMGPHIFALTFIVELELLLSQLLTICWCNLLWLRTARQVRVNVPMEESLPMKETVSDDSECVSMAEDPDA